MAYETGTATSYKDGLDKLRSFLKRANTVTAAVANPGNTGNGTCSQPTADNDAPTELWTLTATTATNFTVVGSVSGPQSNATVGVAYDDVVQFTITAGGTPFVSGDIFTFNVTQELGTEIWTENNYIAGTNEELYMQGPGASANNQIFVGIRTEENVAEPWYNWVLQGYTGYSSLETFHNQLGAMSSVLTPLVLLDNANMKYWFVAKGRRFAGVFRTGTTYEPFYCGFPLVYGLPASWPYPLTIGGGSAYTATSADRKFQSTSATHRGYPDGYRGLNAAYNTIGSLRVLSGGWSTLGNYFNTSTTAISRGNTVSPYIFAESWGGSLYDGYGNDLWTEGDPQLDGSHALFPIVLTQQTPSKNILGELDGIYAVHGSGVVAEDEITISGKLYKVFQNTFLTDAENYFAMLLEE